MKHLFFNKKEIFLSLIFILTGIFSVYRFFTYTYSQKEEVLIYTISFSLIFTPYVLFGTSFFKEILKNKFKSKDSAYFGFLLYLFLSYLLANYNHFNIKLAIIFCVYFFVPYIILRFFRKSRQNFDFYLLLTLIIIAIPINLQLLPKDYSFSKLVIVNLVFFLFLIISEIKDVGYTWNLTVQDLKNAVLGFITFGIVAVPIGIQTGFISFHLTGLSFERVIISVMVIFFFVAIPEEFFFRGIIQNLIEKNLKNKTKYAPVVAILITSIIFGLTHFYKGDWRYIFLAVLGGIVTGVVYYKTKKITASAVSHMLVDATWSLFFITNWQWCQQLPKNIVIYRQLLTFGNSP